MSASYSRLGRRAAPDNRDTKYLIAMLPAAAQVVRRANHRWGFFDKPLDQGATGTCVGHGWKHWLSTAPVIQSDVDAPPHPFDIYDWCTKNDEWDDNDNDTHRQFGTSVRAGAKYMVANGYATEYNWAFEAGTALDWLSGLDASGKFVGGPVVIGVNWYDSMFDTDAEGILRIKPGARVAGGHCVCLIGNNEKRGMVEGLQSWGPWGHRGSGHFFMPHDVLARLIEENGEACTAMEVRRPVL